MKRMLISTAVLALGGTDLVTTATSAQAAPATGVYYAKCADAIAARAAPMYKAKHDPGYRDGLDRDKDGIACDKDLPKEYVKHTPAPATSSKPAPVVSPPAKPVPGKPAPSAPMGPKVSTDLVTPKQDGRNSGVALLTVGALAGLGAVRLRAGKR